MARRTRATDEESFRGDMQEGEAVADQEYDDERSNFDDGDSGDEGEGLLVNPSEWGMGDAVEPYALAAGTQARLRIIDVTRGVNKDNGLRYYVVTVEILDEPYSKNFTFFVNEPMPRKMDAKALNTANWWMGQFIKCFDIDASDGMNPIRDWVKHEGTVILGRRMSRDPQFGLQNFIQKYLLSR